MLRKLTIVTTLALALSGLSFAVSTPDAEAQHARHRVHKKKKNNNTKKKQVRRHRHHDQRHGHRTHRVHSHHRGHSHHRTYRSGVYVSFGSPYWYSTHRHGHHHYYYNSHPHYVHRDTQVVVIDAAPSEPVFVMPSLSCPIRTDEERIGTEQWCATPRGTRHGPYRRYYADGTLAAQGEYEYDQQEGIWLEFHPNGSLREEGQYDDGQRIGTWTTWGSDGEELVSVNY